MTNQDPDRQTLTEWLGDLPADFEADEIDIEQAIYWFASNWHGGQWSNLYSVLSTSQYHPGATERGCDPDGTAADLYRELEANMEHGSANDHHPEDGGYSIA